MLRRLRIADHEATHAIISVNLRLPISDARIDNCGHPSHAGEVNIKASRPYHYVRAYSQDRETGLFVTVDLEAKTKMLERERAEKQIMVGCAGKMRPFAIGGDSGDEALIQQLQKEFNISDERVAQLRRRTNKNVNRRHIQASIQRLSAELMSAADGIVSRKRIRKIYNEACDLSRFETTMDQKTSTR